MQYVHVRLAGERLGIWQGPVQRCSYLKRMWKTTGHDMRNRWMCQRPT